MGVVKLDPKVFVHDAQQGGFEPLTHVDIGIDFRRLVSDRGQNLLLEGIRGTGKTHLLKMVITEAKAHFDKYRVMPIYLSIAGAPQVTQDNSQFFRLYLYSYIIQSVCTFITKNESLIMGNKETFLERIKSLFGFSAGAEIKENIQFLLQLAGEIQQDIVDRPDKVISRINSLQKARTSGTLKIEKVFEIGTDAEVGEGKEKIKEYTAFRLSEITGIDSLLNFLKTTKELLNLNYVYLLLDECSESSKLMQIEIFRLCKQIRAFCQAGDKITNPDIAFLVTVYPPQSTYYPSTTKNDGFNFVPGNDCSIEYLEIDELNDEFEGFFLQLVERRLKLNNGGPCSIDEVFEHQDAISLAAFCSGGVPRRFLEILKQSYSLLSKDYGSDMSNVVHKIDSQYILKGVSQVVDGTTILSHPQLSNDDRAVVEEIIKRFATRNKREESKREKLQPEQEGTPITIYMTAAAKNAEELANLITIGILHDKKRSRARKSAAQSFKGAGTLYALDAGVAVHRGAISRNPARILEICRSDLRNAAYGGFEYVLDLALKEESLESELYQVEEFIKHLESQLLLLDKSLMQSKIDKGVYDSMLLRTTKLLENYKKKEERLKKDLELKKAQSKNKTIPSFEEPEGT